MGDAPRLLIVKLSSMGDVIHALPVVNDIMGALPGAQIDWVIEEGFSTLPRLHPGIRNVLPVALRRWRTTLFAPSTWREMRAAHRSVRATRYDRIIDIQGLLKSAWIARWAQGPSSGFDRESARESSAARCYDRRFAVARTLHAIERNRRLAAVALGYVAAGPPRFTLSVPALHQHQLKQLATRGAYAVLLTNASRATKLWPAQAWHVVEAELARRGLHTILIWGSEAERVATQARVQDMVDAHVAPWATLDQLAALLAHAKVVVGIDTGLTHLAAAVGAPTIGIFCDYDPSLVGIRGEAPCDSLGGTSGGPAANEVLAALERALAPRTPGR
jgi:heptosyltransferase-1